MRSISCWAILSCCFFGFSGLHSQTLDVMFVGWGSVRYQVSADTLVPAGEIVNDRASWEFTAGFQLETGSINGLELSGPGIPDGMPVPYFEDSTSDFELQLKFDSKNAMLSQAPWGTYTFTGMGSGVGSFSENFSASEVDLLEPKHIRNWDALQHVDPASPILIEWESFDDQGAKDGFIELEVIQESRFGTHAYWDSAGIEEGFGMPANTTSVEIPPGTLTGDPREPYRAFLYFARIEQLEEATALGSGIKGYITNTETVFNIHVNLPGHVNLPYKAWIEDSTLGWVYGLTEDWGYSISMGYIWVGNTPEYIYQNTLGWLATTSGSLKDGCWFYSFAAGWIFTRADWSGWYITADQSWYSMIDP